MKVNIMKQRMMPAAGLTINSLLGCHGKVGTVGRWTRESIKLDRVIELRHGRGLLEPWYFGSS